MSYRTCVNGVQIFGNGEYYPEWIEFVKAQGVNVDDDGQYEGDITDFMGAVTVIEKIVLRLNKERESRKERFGGKIGHNTIQGLFDFTNKIQKVEQQSEDVTDGYSVLDELFDIIEMTYAFMPYMLYKACESDLINDHVYSTANHFRCFKLKDNASIHIKAS